MSVELQRAAVALFVAGYLAGGPLPAQHRQGSPDADQKGGIAVPSHEKASKQEETCAEIEGLNPLLEKGTVLVLGELHGSHLSPPAPPAAAKAAARHRGRSDAFRALHHRRSVSYLVSNPATRRA
jgi:hypothetical protein